MSVIAALYSGISGINSNAAALAVAGDNIANMNTTGFKSSASVFESQITEQLGSVNIGLGSGLAGTTANFSQGAFASSTRSTDFAIEGAGFFEVSGSSGTLYTRGGSFVSDANGNLVTAAGGYQLQGQAIDPITGQPSATLSSVNLTSVNSLPVQTANTTVSMNLNSNTPINANPFSATTFQNAQATSDYNTSFPVYDSQGNSRTLTVYFQHTAANTWTYHVTTPGTNLANAGPAAANPVVLQEGTLSFTTGGALSSQATAQISPLGGATLSAGQLINTSLAAPSNEIQWANGASAVPSITFDFGKANPGSTAVTTQVASASTVTNVTQDGRAPGTLEAITTSSNGILTGSFTNGSSRALYQIPIVTFANQEGLTRAGNNVYTQSSTSGTPQSGAANSGGRGGLRSYATEQSNVDLAGEFVKVITFQRAFQASARTVTTAAELLQDLVRLGT